MDSQKNKKQNRRPAQESRGSADMEINIQEKLL